MGVDNETALKQVSLMINEPSLTQLGSWRLTAVLNVPVDTWIGNAAAVLSGTWGAVTRRAQQSGYSRTAVFTHAQQAAQAGRLLVVLDLACQARVRGLCLDEIFLHREPVLMAIEPHSMAWMAGQRGPGRRGERWREVITNWPCLEHVIADGGQGLARGVKLANAARGAQGEAAETVSSQAMTMG